MSGEGLVYRCCECGFVMQPEEPRVLTPFGWTHPICAPEEDQ